MSPAEFTMNTPPNRLTPDIDVSRDHILGPANASVTIVEFGDYQCTYCHSAHQSIRRLREQRLGDRLRYVFRHFPNTRLHPNAWLAAQAAEAAASQDRFWEMHEYLFSHQHALSRDSLINTASKMGLDADQFARELDSQNVDERIKADFSSAEDSGAFSTPTFFINGRRYDGAWDDESTMEAIEEPLGYKLRSLAQEFVGLSASAGLLMLVATLLALVWANSPWSASYVALWHTELVISFGDFSLPLSLHHWINDGMIVIFFFVIGLEIKRELVTGELSDPRQAALPIAAAVGGMVFPATIYLLFNVGSDVNSGWGVPMSTDTAFALGLMAMLGRRVPLSLKIFVAALAIADDVGAILVLALFYTTDISLPSLAVAGVLFGVALALNRARVYRVLPYALVGIAFWLAMFYSGVHTTLAGVLLALTIPTRSPPDTVGLLGQSMSAFHSLEAPPHGERNKSRFQSTVRTLETVVERLLSPAQRMERNLQPWSSYLILPLFALANAGIVLSVDVSDLLQPLSAGLILGLVFGKPLGITLGAWLAVRTGLAAKSLDYSWRQLAGGGCLCGIGFTMSIFIASATFTDPAILTLAKLSVILASLIAGTFGWFVLRGTCSASDQRTKMG